MSSIKRTVIGLNQMILQFGFSLVYVFENSTHCVLQKVYVNSTCLVKNNLPPTIPIQMFIEKLV